MSALLSCLILVVIRSQVQVGDRGCEGSSTLNQIPVFYKHRYHTYDNDVPRRATASGIVCEYEHIRNHGKESLEVVVHAIHWIVQVTHGRGRGTCWNE